MPSYLIHLQPHGATLIRDVFFIFVFDQTTLDPPLSSPPFGFFMETPILLLENASIIAETNFTLGPIPKTLVDWPIKNVNFLYNSGLFSPKILGPLATFEAVDMT